MWNNWKICGILLLAVTACVMPESRAADSRTNSGSGAKTEIPEKVLQPQVAPDYFKAPMDKLLTRLNQRVPQELRDFKKADKNSYAFITPTYLRSQVKMLNRIISHPDLEEVTGNQRLWYQQMLKLLNDLQIPVQELQKALEMNDAKAYRTAVIHYDMQMNAIGNWYKRGPLRLKAEEYARICKANRERRKQEYLKSLAASGTAR